MDKVVSRTATDGPLARRLKKADLDNDIIVALEPGDSPDLDKMLDAAKEGRSPLEVKYLDAAKTVRGGTVTINLTARSLARLVLDAEDTEAADNIEVVLQQALGMATGFVELCKVAWGLESFKVNSAAEMASQIGSYTSLLKLAEQLIDGAKVEKSGSQVTVDVKRPEILNIGLGRFVSPLKLSVMEARTAAPRTQQMNNLKQVSLAMIMHETSRGAFPPATIEKDGKPLLSWRVAILPYLGNEANIGGSTSTSLGIARTILKWPRSCPRFSNRRTVPMTAGHGSCFLQARVPRLTVERKCWRRR